MKYWDASALVPLILHEPKSSELQAILIKDPLIVSWWGTPVECISAFWRRKRAGGFTDSELRMQLERFARLTPEIDFVAPSMNVRERASRLLSFHSLKAGDALQLGAALRWTEDQPRHSGFVCLDGRLRGAALAEGFHVFPEHD